MEDITTELNTNNDVEGVNEVPNMSAHIRNQSLRKFFDEYCSNKDANDEFRPMDTTVKVPDRYALNSLWCDVAM